MSTKVQAAPPRDYAQETRDTLATQLALAPQLYASEAQYQPLYNRLQLGLTEQALLGTQGQRGLLDIYQTDVYPRLGAMERQTLEAQRAGDISDVERLGPRATQAFLAANPQLAASLERAEAMGGPQQSAAMQRLGETVMGQQPSRISQALEQGVLTGLSADGGLTDAERRSAEQQVRASYAARGMAMSPQAISAEVQNRLINQRARQLENLQIAQAVNAQLLGERQAGIQNLGQFAQLGQAGTAADRAYQAQLVGLRQATASDPFMAILGRPSQAFQQGQGFGAQGMAVTQAAGPALFNPESSYASNIYAGNQQTRNAANIASAQARASMISGLAGGAGSILGGMATGGTGFFKP